MKYFFEDIEKQKELFKEINEWIGTPYRHRCMVKQKGTDCIHFLHGVYLGINIVKKKIKLPDYAPDWHLHHRKELLYHGIMQTGLFEDIPVHDKLMNGDILLYRYGNACSHCAIYFDQYIYHSLTGKAVSKNPCNDPTWFSRLKYILRMKG